MVLICLLYKSFVQNLSSNFPNHVIRVRKEDVSRIETIDYRHNYSRVNLTGSSMIDLSRLVNLRKFILVLFSNCIYNNNLYFYII